MKSQPIILLVLSTLLALCAFSNSALAISRKARLGQALFSDTNLSSPPGQACASCHSPDHLFIDPDTNEPTSEGVIEGRYGSRNAPTLMYTSASPRFHFDKGEGLFVGGQFDDGRAPTTRDQAKQPFLQALEMNNQNAGAVVEKVRTASYVDLFKRVYGANSLNNPAKAYASDRRCDCGV
jgi:cytochrome c peroxidase